MRIFNRHTRAAAIHRTGSGRVFISVVDLQIIEVRLDFTILRPGIELKTRLRWDENSNVALSVPDVQTTKLIEMYFHRAVLILDMNII